MITYLRPHTGAREAIAAGRVIMGRWLGKGLQVAAFEQEFARFVGVDPGHLMTTASASDALCLSMELLGVGPGDEVIIPAIHYVGAANAVLRRGARPVFCDVDGLTLNTTPRHVRAAVTDKTRAVVVLHYGVACDVRAIAALGFPVVEDCAVGLGIVPCGNMAVWSFDAMKTIATPGGGALWCADGYRVPEARRLCNQGMSDAHGYASDRARWWEFEVATPGRLSEMSDVAAAIGRQQLRRMKHDLGRRLGIARQYARNLGHLVAVGRANPSLCPIQTERRDDLAAYLRLWGIYTSFRYHPLHWAYLTGRRLPGAEYAAERTLLLPNHAGLSGGDVRRVIHTVREFYERGNP